MKNLNRKVKILIISTVVLLVVLTFGVFNRSQNTQKLSIKASNVAEIQIYKNDEPNKSIKKLPGNSQEIHLKKGEYVVRYSGSEGYASGEENVRMAEELVSLELNPGFSAEKLKSLLENEKTSINNAIKSQIRGIELYLVNEGALYRYGDWYGGTLIYNGPDFYNADSLRFVLKKEGANWILMTKPPEIILTKVLYPDVPEEVLESTNNQNAPIQSRYTDSD